MNTHKDKGVNIKNLNIALKIWIACTVFLAKHWKDKMYKVKLTYKKYMTTSSNKDKGEEKYKWALAEMKYFKTKKALREYLKNGDSIQTATGAGFSSLKINL